MKRTLPFTILCLFLAACGTFAVQVKIVTPEANTAAPGANVTQAWATTFAAATAYSKDPQGQSQVMTQAAATLQTGNRQATNTPIPSLTPTPVAATATATAEPTATPWALEVGNSITLAAIQMNDLSRGWGVESGGHLVKTGDGGWTWKDVTPFQGPISVHGLFTFNNETVWAVPAQLHVMNVVWRTQDSGVTWEASQFIPLGDGVYSPLGLQFPDARHGWLLLLAKNGAQSNHVLLYKSNDGGENWEPVNKLNESLAQSYLPDTDTTMAFFDGQAGWLGGWWGKDNPNQWLILNTADGGATWGMEELSLPNLNSITCNGHPIVNMAPGSMAVEMTCSSSKDPHYSYHHIYYLSVSIAPRWYSWQLTGEFLSGHFLNASQGWMMITSNTPHLNYMMYTRDGGKNWTKIGQVSWQQAQFDFINTRDGWAIVGNGVGTALVRTKNGGKTWSQIGPVADR